KRGTDALREEELLKEAREDAEVLQLAAQALKEAQQVAAKWTKGQKLALEFLNETGAVERVEGPLLRIDPFRVELAKNGADPRLLLLGEIRAGSLARALKESKGPAQAELRGLALLCLLEGDPEAAQALLEGTGASVPDRIRAWATELPPGSPREQEARELL